MEQVNTKKKVLIVDDEPNVRRLLHSILGKTFEVFEAEDGRQAIEMVNSQKPDVVLMDMMMPKMDGLTACHMIKNDPATKSIPVIMVTAIGFELNIKLSQQMGASGYVTKPFSSEDLLDKIAQVLTAV
ncbi:MAG TPA: response regulator [Dehalococcoidales bacterium]|jgi:CheY-like chemotaxis protein|nr:response regulator [Dehalococcoidales bacterium]